MESSSSEKNLGVLVDGNLCIGSQYALAERKDCVNRNTAGRLGEEIFSPLLSTCSPASSFGSPDRGKGTIICSEFSRGPPNWLGGGALELLREAEIVGLVQAGEEMALEETQQQPTSITYG